MERVSGVSASVYVCAYVRVCVCLRWQCTRAPLRCSAVCLQTVSYRLAHYAQGLAVAVSVATPVLCQYGSGEVTRSSSGRGAE